mmetsp:Transcript_18820/g.20940  ORF Transcript_18820/g.20940 Transcript_18820/m.20940 type:complete len:448 (+) Transcript_18820:78-1421(+)
MSSEDHTIDEKEFERQRWIRRRRRSRRLVINAILSSCLVVIFSVILITLLIQIALSSGYTELKNNEISYGTTEQGVYERLTKPYTDFDPKEYPLKTDKCIEWSEKHMKRGRQLWDIYVTASEKLKDLESYPISSINNITSQRYTPYRLIAHDCLRELLTFKLNNSNERKINIFIAVHNRLTNLKHAVKSLETAAQAAGNVHDLHIVIIESGSNECEEFSQSEDAVIQRSYLRVPSIIGSLWGCSGLFPTSVLYNLGFLTAREAEWNLFYVADFVVPKTFFTNNKIHDGADAFYPYKRAVFLNKKQTQALLKIWKNVGYIPDNRIRFGHKSIKPHGGALYIRTDAFKAVGGYDPELFCGWAPEDTSMRNKLVRHLETGKDLERRQMDLYHIYHDDSTGGGYYTAMGLWATRQMMTVDEENMNQFLQLKSFLLLLDQQYIRELVTKESK